MPAGYQHQRKQDAEVRLGREQADATTGQHWPTLQSDQRPADQGGRGEPVLPDYDVRQDTGIGACQENAGAMSEDGAYAGDIGGKCNSYPRRIGGNEWKHGEQCGDQEECWRIDPGIFSGKWVPERCHFRLLVQGYVVGSIGISSEDLPAARPDIDEISRNPLPAGIEDPASSSQRGEKVGALRDAQSKADQLDRTRQPK
jgi:hypothetical protein